MDWIDEVVKDVGELADRNSPEDWPEAMIVTAEELKAIIAFRVGKVAEEVPEPQSHNGEYSIGYTRGWNALCRALVPNVVGKGRCAALYRAASSDRRERP